ncbi:TetR/AcrR family transcriptional regulator [Fructilactobacillus sp. Tb1]|uniref:TetR/AcrR family transcriptional regulator n=1 Tax=Fructilactobacillus sp. Tb1 TaxID=3422304 RepID=UPI003D28A865
MPSKTFMNLNDDKRNRITTVLLSVFSQDSLNEAKVSTIVKQAGISRGAFYKYFSDLNDAYQYIFRIAMQNIHRPFKFDRTLNTETIMTAIQEFVNQQRDGKYHDFIKLYYQKNQYLLPTQYEPDVSKLSPEQWSSSVLIHQTIKDCLLYPAAENKYLDLLKKSLNKLFKEDN